MPEFFVVLPNGAEDGGSIARGIPLGCSTLGSDSCGGGLSSSSDIEEREDSGDRGSQRDKGIELMSREEVGGGLTGLGVTSPSGPSGDIRGVIAGDCVNENVITSRPEATKEC